MPLSVTCPSCTRRLRVKDDLAGKRVRCPQCGQAVAIGTAATAGPTQPRPAGSFPGGLWLWIGGTAALGLLVLVGLAVLVVVLVRPSKTGTSGGKEQATSPSIAEHEQEEVAAAQPPPVTSRSKTEPVAAAPAAREAVTPKEPAKPEVKPPAPSPPKKEPEMPKASVERDAIRLARFLPLKTGSRWTYRLNIPKTCSIPHDPFFLNAPGLLSSNRTHGSIERPATTATFTVTVKGIISESDSKTVARVEIEDGGLTLWLPPLRLVETRFVAAKDANEMRLVIDGYFTKPDDLGVGEVLVRVPLGPGSATTEEVQVPAGRYSAALRSTVTHEANNNTPAFAQHAWVAEGVGLVKYAVKDARNELLYTMELVRHETGIGEPAKPKTAGKLKGQIIGKWAAIDDRNHTVEFLSNGVGVIIQNGGQLKGTFYDFVTDDTIEFADGSGRVKLSLSGDILNMAYSSGRTVKLKRAK